MIDKAPKTAGNKPGRLQDKRFPPLPVLSEKEALEAIRKEIRSKFEEKDLCVTKQQEVNTK